MSKMKVVAAVLQPPSGVALKDKDEGKAAHRQGVRYSSGSSTLWGERRGPTQGQP